MKYFKKKFKDKWGLKPFLLIFVSSVPAIAYGETCQFTRALEFSHLNLPRNSFHITDHIVMANELDETLIRTNTMGKIDPGLAQQWNYDSDKNEITFTLSDGCGWSDGAKIKAQDVVAGFQNLYKFGSPIIPSWDVIRGAREIVDEGKNVETLAVTAIDDRTVKIGVVGDPDFALQSLSYIAFTPLPTHLKGSPQAWELVSPSRVTSGPYRILTSNRNQIIAIKNEHYCKSRPAKIHRIRFFNNNDEFIPIREFMAGKIDIIRDVSSSQLKRILDSYPKDSRPNFTSENTYRQIYMVLNSELNGLQDKDIRAAIRPGIDFPNLLEPRGTIEQYFKKANSIFYNLPRYENIKYSMEEVSLEMGLRTLKSIMESKGYSAINPLKLTIKTWPIPRFRTVSKLVSSMLRSTHFDIEFVSSKSVADAYQDLKNGNFDIFIGSWVLDYLDPQNSWEGIRQLFLPALYSKANLADFGLDPDFRKRIDQLNIQLVAAKSTEERHKYLQALEKLLSDARVILPLYSEKTGILYAKELNLSNELSLFARRNYWKKC